MYSAEHSDTTNGAANATPDAAKKEEASSTKMYGVDAGVQTERSLLEAAVATLAKEQDS